MLVEVHDDSLAVSWQRVPPHVHAELVESMKYITGASFDARAKCWRVPLRQADRVYAALPDFSYSYDAICAVVDAAARHIDLFARNLLAGGVELVVVLDQVFPVGDNVSPLVERLVAERNDALLQWLVDERAAELAEWLAEQQSAAAQPKRPHSRQQPAATPQAQREAELLVSSLRNAAANEQRRAAKMTKPNEHND